MRAVWGTMVSAAAMVVATAAGAQSTSTTQTSSPSLPDETADAPRKTSQSSVEDIVVTAQRRSERLQDVPVAVTATSAARLASAGVNSTQQLAIVTPGLSAPQVAGFTQPHIRGVGSSTNGPGLEQPVATYIDGVYIAAAPAALMTLNSVERVEVLKGPQGTLFGRNATGGLIQVITRDPLSTLSASVNLTFASYQNLVADAYVTGPILDTLSADLAVRYETQQRGWGQNLATGTPVGDLRHDFAVRSKLLWEPSALTQVRATFDYEDRDSRQETQKLDLRQFPATFSNPGFGGPFPQGGKYDVNNDVDQVFRLKAGGASLQIKHELGAVTLQSITAYRETKYHFLLDLDMTPANLLRLDASPRDKQFSQELQLSSASGDKLSYTAGIYYFWADDRYSPLNIQFGPSFLSPVPGAPVTAANDDRMITNSIAGYAQASYEILRDTKLTLGGRYTYEAKKLDGTSSFLVNGQIVAQTPIPVPGSGISPRVNFKKFNYRISLDHKFGPDILGYVSWNTGFKSGGYNLAVPANAPYQPEEIKAAEIGLKADLLNRRVRINTAGYYYTYSNIQVGRYIDNSLSIYNGAKARIYGFDLDGQIALARGVSISGGLAYSHTEFRSFPNADYIVPACGLVPQPGGVVSCSAAGNDLPFSPRLTYNVGGNYKIDLPIGVIDLNATYFRTSRFFANADNVASQAAYDLINASIGWTSPDQHLTAKIWGRNLGNSYYSVSLVEASQGVLRANGAPRTYGLTLGYKF